MWNRATATFFVAAHFILNSLLLKDIKLNEKQIERYLKMKEIEEGERKKIKFEEK